MFEDSASTVSTSIWASMNSWFTPTVLFVLLNVMIGTIAFTSTLANQKQTHQNQEQESPNESSEQNPKLAKSPSVLQRLRSINFNSYRSQEPKSSPDSETHYQFDHVESQTHYIFDPEHEHQTIDSETTHYSFEQKNEENVHETQSQYVFHQTHHENIQESPTQYQFQKVEDMNTHFNLHKTHEEKVENEEETERESLDEVYSQLRNRHVSRSRSDTKPSSGEAPAKLPTKMKKSASMKSPFAHFEEEEIVEARRPATTRPRNTKTTSEVDDEVDAKADDFINKFKQQLKLQRVDSILRYKDMIGRGTER